MKIRDGAELRADHRRTAALPGRDRAGTVAADHPPAHRQALAGLDARVRRLALPDRARHAGPDGGHGGTPISRLTGEPTPLGRRSYIGERHYGPGGVTAWRCFHRPRVASITVVVSSVGVLVGWSTCWL